MNLVRGDNLLAEGEAGHRDHLDVGNCQRDTDDGDGLEESGGDVADGQPQSSYQEPNDIGDAAHGASSGHRHYFAAKGPQYIVGDPEAGHTGRQGYYQDAGDNAEEDVAQGQPDTAEKQPNDV